MRRKAAEATLLVVLSAVGVAQVRPQPGTLVTAVLEERVSAQEIVDAGDLLFEGLDGARFEAPSPRYPVDVYRLWYWSTDADGSPAVVEGSLFVPAVWAPATGPVLAFGSGTTGVGDQCAPSLEQPYVIRWGYYRANMLYYAGQGVITIFPDYLGFNDPDRPQRYFSAAAEGHLMLDSLRAARRFFDEYTELLRTRFRPGPGNVTAGYSQGGHAALAAADMVAEYAPDIRLDGAIGFGSTNSVETLMKTAAYYTPYIIYTYWKVYGEELVDPADFIQAKWLDTFEEDILGMCVNDFQYYYPFYGSQLYTPEFNNALFSDTLDVDFPEFKHILDENETGLSGHGLPVLFVEGLQDIIMLPEDLRAYVERLRAAGSEVELLEIDHVRHRHSRPAGFVVSLEFIRRVTAE
jgi:hypothetical protein